MRIAERGGIVLAMGLVSASVSGMATAQVASDSTALSEFVDAYQSAMDTGDAAVVSAFFSEDADLVAGDLPGIEGREAIEAFWRTYFERREPDRRGRFDVTSERFLSPDVALLNLASTTGGEDLGGALPVRRARATWLLRRHGDRWLIEAARAMPTEKDRVELVSSRETTESLRPDIRAFVAAYADTFTRHDADGLSGFYRDDADIIIRNNPVIHGARAIRESWRTYFSQPRPYRSVMIVEKIRMMADDVALVSLIATGKWLDTTDPMAPTRQARATWVIVREDDEWRIAALRVLPSEQDRVIRESDR